MSDIKGLPSNVNLGPILNEPTPEQVAVKSSQASASVQDVHEAAGSSAHANEVASTLPPPNAPSTGSMSGDQTSGAVAFAGQLGGLGAIADANDALMLAFLKLQLLDDTENQSAANLLNAGKLTLRHVSHTDFSAAGVMATNQVRAGTENASAVLRNAQLISEQRNQLVALLAGLRPDIKQRKEAPVEIDKTRNDVADLVIGLIDKHEATRAQMRGI